MYEWGKWGGGELLSGRGAVFYESKSYNKLGIVTLQYF